MSVNCTLCGVSMAVAEQTGLKGQKTPTGSYHRDCAELAYELATADDSLMPAQHAIIQRKIDKLVHKKNSVADEFP